MSDENETVAVPELHPDVAAFDAQIAATHGEGMSDAHKQAFDSLVEERNEAFKRHHPVTPGEAPA